MEARDQMIAIFNRLNPGNQQETLAYARVALAAENSARKSLQPAKARGTDKKNAEKAAKKEFV
jgi:hypothetical protein